VTRFLSGAALAATAVAMIVWLPTAALRVVACAVAALAALEYLALVRANPTFVVAVVVACWLASSGSATGLVAVPFLALVAAAIRVLVQRDAAATAAAGAFAAIYIGAPLGLLVSMHARRGWQTTVLVIAAVAVSDTAQYYAGRLFGRHALAPAISPKKTIEGALGGLVFVTLFMATAGARVLMSTATWSLAALGAAVVVLGICGDLFESQIKREAGAKDSGTLIPGHGGVLDRIDALLFATPAFAFVLGVVP
jgi:phosphatidate cytidylyltransferase